MHSSVTPKPFGVPGGVSVIKSTFKDWIVKEVLGALSVCLYNLLDGVTEGMTRGEAWVVRFDFG